VSNLGIHNFDDPPAVLRECRRIAKPGASLCVTTNLAGHMAELYEVLGATLRELELDGAALEAHVAARGTLASVSALLETCGFEIVRRETGAFRMRYAD